MSSLLEDMARAIYRSGNNSENAKFWPPEGGVEYWRDKARAALLAVADHEDLGDAVIECCGEDENTAIITEKTFRAICRVIAQGT